MSLARARDLHRRPWRTHLKVVVAVLALAAVSFGLARLAGTDAALEVTETRLGPTPVTIYSKPGGAPAPAILIAHGFAGSQQLMQPFAITLAQAGYLAVTYDLLGHGGNRDPLRGDVRDETGATRFLLEEMAKVADYATGLPGSDGRLALLGHSMSSDLVVRFAKQHPDQVTATVAVSLFSRQVTAQAPGNMLIVVGAWEPGLTAEGLRVLRLTGGETAQEGQTVGTFQEGNARRLVFADGVEHIGVLYSPESLAETVAWLNAAFGRSDAGDPALWGWPLALLFGGLVVLAWPLSHLLPRAVPGGWGAELPWRRLLPLAFAPALLTPLILRLLPTDFLPILVGDYLALHFALYGLLTAAGLWLVRRHAAPKAVSWPKTAVASLLVTLYGAGALGLALDAFVLNLQPTGARWGILAILLAGTLVYFLADEWLTRGQNARAGAYPVTKLCFAVSLAIAVALDLERLFFLIIIIPLIGGFFLVYGLLSRWSYRRTGQPLAAGVANALVFAWAIAMTFPILGG